MKTQVNGKTLVFFTEQLGNMPLVIIKARKGYVACSYISKETAEKVGDVAVFVSGVKSIDDMINAKVKDVTSWAEDLGIRAGMSVRKALEILDGEE
jgi:uncharacterized protein YunC (DUF1805 family)